MHKTLTQSKFYRRETPYVPSLNLIAVDNCVKKDILVYTGEAMLGIATMHKSNLIPIFSNEEAEAISRMRR